MVEKMNPVGGDYSGTFHIKDKLEKAVHETIEEQNRLQLLNKLNKKVNLSSTTNKVISFYF